MNNTSRHLVHFSQEGSVYVAEGQSLLDAALAAKVPLYHVCGGKAKCSTCRVHVVRGSEFLSPPTPRETILKRQMHFPRNVRLGCQTYLTGGPVQVSRILKNKSDMELYVGAAAGKATQQIGEERELALLFLDIKEFTPFIGKNLAFDVIHVVRKLFVMVEKVISKHDGRIIELAGDGIYVAFGLNSTITAAVQYAVAASYKILEELNALNDSYFIPYFNYYLQIGMGIHKGSVITANLLLGSAFHFIVMGYPVNIAARLQSLTRKLNNNIIVSDEIFSLLDAPPASHKKMRENLKGVAGLCQVHLIGFPYDEIKESK